MTKEVFLYTHRLSYSEHTCTAGSIHLYNKNEEIGVIEYKTDTLHIKITPIKKTSPNVEMRHNSILAISGAVTGFNERSYAYLWFWV